MPHNVIIWGATGQAIVLEELLSQQNYKIEAIFDNNPNCVSPFENVPMFYSETGFFQWKNNAKNITNTFFVVAIGGDKGEDRVKISLFLKEQGLKPLTTIHPKANLALNSKIHEGAQILINATVCAQAEIGAFSIVNSSASIDHECKIGKGCHIGPGAKLAGCVTIDDYTFIGTGAVVLPHLKIGKNVTVGAGAIVTKNLPDKIIAYGNPAQIIHTKDKSDIFSIL